MYACVARAPTTFLALTKMRGGYFGKAEILARGRAMHAPTKSPLGFPVGTDVLGGPRGRQLTQASPRGWGTAERACTRAVVGVPTSPILHPNHLFSLHSNA